MIFKVKCPYCGFANKVAIGQDFYIPKEVITCSDCEKDFVINVENEVIIKTFKIEGQEGQEEVSKCKN